MFIRVQAICCSADIKAVSTFWAKCKRFLKSRVKRSYCNHKVTVTVITGASGLFPMAAFIIFLITEKSCVLGHI